MADQDNESQINRLFELKLNRVSSKSHAPAFPVREFDIGDKNLSMNAFYEFSR